VKEPTAWRGAWRWALFNASPGCQRQELFEVSEATSRETAYNHRGDTPFPTDPIPLAYPALHPKDNRNGTGVGGGGDDQGIDELRSPLQLRALMVIPTGIEPVTYRLGICRSILLSYGTTRANT
jgi:hypothetical protein